MVEIWSFLHPFSYKVWVWLVITFPIFTLALLATNYRRNLSWETLIGFVLRVAMVDDGKYPFKVFNNVKQNNSLKLLAILWMWACFILIQSYAGNLIAILTRPTLKKPIDSLEDLLTQKDLKWNLADDGNDIVEYLKTSESLQPLYDLAEKDNDWNLWYQCFSREAIDAGTYVSICHDQSIRFDKSEDFRKTGKCNFYSLDETFFTTPQVMAFQVSEARTNISRGFSFLSL